MLDFSSGWEERYRWWSMPLGQAFLNAESEELSKIIPTLFGYHFLLLGEEIFMGTLSQSPILHRVWSHPMLRKLTAHSGLTARHDKLPIASDCIDAMYLAHCLEVMNNPHEVFQKLSEYSYQKDMWLFQVLTPGVGGGFGVTSCV